MGGFEGSPRNLPARPSEAQSLDLGAIGTDSGKCFHDFDNSAGPCIPVSSGIGDLGGFGQSFINTGVGRGYSSSFNRDRLLGSIGKTFSDLNIHSRFVI